VNTIHEDNCTTYDTKTCGNNYIEDQLSLEIKDVDDLVIAWIVDSSLKFHRLDESKNPKLEDTVWLWRNGGKHGKGKINITQWLHENWDKLSISNNQVLYLAIAAYDFPYNKWASAGKWSYDASLILNGVTKWRQHNFGFSDVKNNIYGLKDSKIIKIQIQIDEHSARISETIDKNMFNGIIDHIKNNYNYKSVEDLKKNKTRRYEESPKENSKKGLVDFILDAAIASVILIATFCFAEPSHILYYFMGYNIAILVYFFFRFKIGGMAWALVLRKKHEKELDNFMVILGLLFTASLGAITSFDFDATNLQNSWLYKSAIFLLYMSVNIVFLYILSVISAYTVNTLDANKPLMLTLILLIGIGIFIQEVVNFEQNYKENISKIEVLKINHAAKK